MTHPGGRTVVPTQAGWDRLVYTATGTVTVHAARDLWTVPPHRALWLPDGIAATMANRHPVAIRTLYFAAHLDACPPTAHVVALDGFPRELLLHVVRVCPLDDSRDTDRALLSVLLDQLHALPRTGLHLATPRTPETQRAADIIRAQPDATIDVVARQVDVSRRTLERWFLGETGVSLGAWRRRAHILDSLEPLSAGESVTQVSARAGYSTPSAFVTAFTRELGEPPRRFMSVRPRR
ncbi:helix-turn-helix transcriptional regulator [Streptomyces sp. SID6673]|nr:helix-turn-helix transcriptional regulator [Streptomyces sp. SID11726]NEB26985.1 helix-turn-helix transcriptional regulator [Streptomyces sp. SID6673]